MTELNLGAFTTVSAKLAIFWFSNGQDHLKSDLQKVRISDPQCTEHFTWIF